MGRLFSRLAVAVAGAFPALLSSHAWAAAAVHTPGSLEIREAATVSVVNQPSLQLLLTSGTDTTFTMTAAPAPSSGTGAPAAPLLVPSGPWAGTASSGEVLSVSLASADGEDSSLDHAQVKFIIAQFN